MKLWALKMKKLCTYIAKLKEHLNKEHLLRSKEHLCEKSWQSVKTIGCDLEIDRHTRRQNANRSNLCRIYTLLYTRKDNIKNSYCTAQETELNIANLLQYNNSQSDSWSHAQFEAMDIPICRVSAVSLTTGKGVRVY